MLTNDVNATNSVPWRLNRLSATVYMCRNCIADLLGISVLHNIISSLFLLVVAAIADCSFAHSLFFLVGVYWSVRELHAPAKHINMSKHQDKRTSNDKHKKNDDDDGKKTHDPNV